MGAACVHCRLFRNYSVEPMQMNHRDTMHTEKTKNSPGGSGSLTGALVDPSPSLVSSVLQLFRILAHRGNFTVAQTASSLAVISSLPIPMPQIPLPNSAALANCSVLPDTLSGCRAGVGHSHRLLPALRSFRSLRCSTPRHHDRSVSGKHRRDRKERRAGTADARAPHSHCGDCQGFASTLVVPRAPRWLRPRRPVFIVSLWSSR